MLLWSIELQGILFIVINEILCTEMKIIKKSERNIGSKIVEIRIIKTKQPKPLGKVHAAYLTISLSSTH